MNNASFWFVVPMLAVLTGSATAQTDTKLLYNQKQAVDRQKRNMSEIEKQLDALVELEKKLKHYSRQVKPGLGIEEGFQKIYNDLDKNRCPRDNSEVAALLTRVETAKKTIRTLEPKLKAKFEEYDKWTNMTHYPDYQEDSKQLDSLYRKYNHSADVFRQSSLFPGVPAVPRRASELAEDVNGDAGFFNAKRKQYAPIINFKTPEGNRISQKFDWAGEQMKLYLAAQDVWAKESPEKFPKLMAMAEQMATRAKNQKNPLIFTGGLRQVMENATIVLETYASIVGEDSKEYKNLTKLFDNTKAGVDATAKTMEKQIIASAKIPDELYDGSDKPNLRKMVAAKWKELHPAEKVLAIRFHQEKWRRNTKWTFSASDKSWYKTDKSVMAVTVIVKTDDHIATMYMAFLNKDHVTRDSITVGADTKAGGYVVQKMLLKNVVQ